jgi:hypothetical protein
MHSRNVNVACPILLTISACGGQPSAPAAAPTTLYLVPAPEEARPTGTPFQPRVADIGIRGFSAVIPETPMAATIDFDTVIPATITPSGAHDLHLSYRGHSRNARCWAENMAPDALRCSA